MQLRGRLASTLKILSKPVSGNQRPCRRRAVRAYSALRHDIEMGHHPSGVMLEDVAVIHPAPGPIIRLPGDADGCTGWHVHDVLPRAPRRRLTIHRQDLKEKAVQMEGMVHQGRIDDVPDLQLAGLHRLVPMVGFLVDHEIHDVPPAPLDTELYRARGRERL